MFASVKCFKNRQFFVELNPITLGISECQNQNETEILFQFFKSPVKS